MAKKKKKHLIKFEIHLQQKLPDIEKIEHPSYDKSFYQKPSTNIILQVKC